MTPFGVAMKMLNMHGKQELLASSSGMDKNGKGLGVLGSKDEKSIIIQLWNYSVDSASGKISVQHIPQEFSNTSLYIRKISIDGTHNNVFFSENKTGDFEAETMKFVVTEPEMKLNFALEPMSLCMWVFETPVK